MDHIQHIIQEMGGEMTVDEGAYSAAVFTSPLFGFVDDVEWRNDTVNSTIHLRSASRVGHSDFGANRKRVVLISSLFHQRVNMAAQDMAPTTK